MATRIFLAALVFLGYSGGTGWSQDVPPPPPAPDIGPALPSPPSDVAPAPPAYGASPSGPFPQSDGNQPSPTPAAVYGPPPGAVMVAPGQPYAYPAYPAAPAYEHPVYGRPLVVVAAPPISSYDWSAAIDALFLERSSGGSIPLGYSVYNRLPGRPPTQPTGQLYSDDAPLPLAAGLRLEITRQLTDYVSLSATYWGLQQWSVADAIYGDPYDYTVLAFSPHLQLPTLLNGLDDMLGYRSSSQIENVEVNALFRLSSSNPYWHLDWLWGARYMNLGDQFTLTGSDIANGAVEDLSYTTSNNLVGVQTGLLFVQGWSRFQWETGFKVGLMANIYRQHGTDTASDASGVPPGFVPYDISDSGSGLSALFEISLAARFRLTENLFLRLGYQFYDITGLALAPRQLSSFGHGGNLALDGLSIGVQATW